MTRAKKAAEPTEPPIPRDPRDINPPPYKFGIGYGRQTMRPPNEVGDGLDGITYGKIYWIYGTPPRDCPHPGVSDPPVSGWSTAFCLPEDDTHVTLFHPWTMAAWRVRKDCYELTSFQGEFEGYPSDRMRQGLPRAYAEYHRRGEAGAAYSTCARVLRAMGMEPPNLEELRSLQPLERGPVAKAPPKPKEATSPFRPVKREGRRGEVLQFFLDGGGKGSIAAATAKFSITRSNLLSQLFLLRKEHGIGYTAAGDEATVQVPEGVELFK